MNDIERWKACVERVATEFFEGRITSEILATDEAILKAKNFAAFRGRESNRLELRIPYTVFGCQNYETAVRSFISAAVAKAKLHSSLR